MKIKEILIENVKIPPKPGTLPIPPNTVRRFHVTNSKNYDSILTHGLTMQHQRVIDGTKYIYSWNNYPRAVAFSKASDNPGKFLLMSNHAIIVEFYDDKNNYNDNNDAGRTNHDIKPEQILAIHQLWSTIYHLVKDGEVTIDQVKSGSKIEPQMKIVLDIINKENGGKNEIS